MSERLAVQRPCDRRVRDGTGHIWFLAADAGAFSLAGCSVRRLDLPVPQVVNLNNPGAPLVRHRPAARRNEPRFRRCIRRACFGACHESPL